jgi:hypothetical protein
MSKHHQSLYDARVFVFERAWSLRDGLQEGTAGFEFQLIGR